MKNIFKSIILCLGLVSLGACEHDPDPIVQTGSFTARSAQAGNTFTLQPQNDADATVVLDWDLAVNGDFNSISTYKVQIAEGGTNFASPVFANGGTRVPDVTTYTLSVAELNSLLYQLPNFTCGVPMNIDIRVVSLLGEGNYNEFQNYSNTISVVVTPYTLDTPTIAFTANASDAANSQKLASTGALSKDYEGFLYLEPGTYFFFQPNDCVEYTSLTTYGVSGGGNSGNLVAGGTTGYTVATAGHYFVKANLEAGVLTYTIAPFSGANFGIFGRATKAIGFATTTPMTYNPVSKTWSITIELINGQKFGFKTDNATTPAAVFTGSGVASTTVANPLTISAPPIDNLGTISAPGTFVNNNTKTKYDIVVDVSVPRNYSFMLTPNTTP